MKKLALLFLLAGLASFVFFRLKPGVPVPAATTQRYVCSMRCLNGKTYGHPGKCPVCHMELVPIRPSEASQPRSFEMWPRVQGRTALYFRPYTAGPQTLQRVVRVAGRLDRAGTKLNVSLEPGESGVKAGQSAMVWPASGSVRPVLARVVRLQKDCAVLGLVRPLSGQDFGQAEISVERPVALAVPDAAVWQVGEETRLFFKTAGGYEARPVKVGLWGERFVEVVEGLKAGDEIAGSGLFWLEADATQRGRR
jgi:hypothetical protein